MSSSSSYRPPLSSFTLFRFPYSPLILRSPPFTPYTPPTDLPLSSFILFPFLLHHSPFHRSPHILRSHLFTPYTPPIPLPPPFHYPMCLPPPIDLPLSSFTLFPFPLHRSPSYPSPRILRSRPSIPYTPPISLLPFTASCPSSSYRPSPLLSPLPSYPSLVMPPRAPMPYFPHAFPFCSFSTRIQLCYYYC